MMKKWIWRRKSPHFIDLIYAKYNPAKLLQLRSLILIRDDVRYSQIQQYLENRLLQKRLDSETATEFLETVREYQGHISQGHIFKDKQRTKRVS